MRYFTAVSFFCLVFCSNVFSQTAIIRGTIKDRNTGELLFGANVVQPPTNGVSTDVGGNYELKVNAGHVTLIISYLGLNTDTQQLEVKDGQTKYLNVGLVGGQNELQMVVVSESKVGQKLQTVTQTVDVIKPRLLEANNITNFQSAITKLPGVSILDGQVSVRGGSGYAYGAGSRVTLVVDELPLMTADRQDIKWSFIPIENVEQVELLKGASSMQYGAGALNGTISVTTAYARDTPITKLTFFYEGIGKPPVDSFRWWKRDGKFFQNPNRIGMNFLHAQKFGDFEFVFSGMAQGWQSHLQSDYEHYIRFNGKLRWHPHKLNRLNLELSASTLYDATGFQFYWVDGGHPYIGNSGVILNQRYFFAHIDPKFSFIDKTGSEHKILTRAFRQKYLEGVSNFWITTVAYQFRHNFKYFQLLAGVNNDHWNMEDGTLGKHKGDFGGGYIRGKFTYKFLTLTAGLREEYVHEDSAITPTIPVVGAGANFEIRKYNFIRLSFGQAFRIPSIAEKYVLYSLGGVQILPNLALKPERGFTTEIGYKRMLKIGNWLGYFDASVFWTEFKDMIEFTFGSRALNVPPYFQPYFQSQNIARARIFGWEFQLYGVGNIAPNVDLAVQMGYTYFYGVDLNAKDGPDNNHIGSFLKNAFTHYTLPTAKDAGVWDSLTRGLLKYRNPHQFKADFDFIFFKKYHFGTSLQYYSYMDQVDAVFAIQVPGIDEYRTQHRNKGDFIWDLRTGYEFNKNLALNFLVKNVLNTYTVIRIARPDAPRSFTVQLVVNFGASKHRNDLKQLSGSM